MLPSLLMRAEQEKFCTCIDQIEITLDIDTEAVGIMT